MKLTQYELIMQQLIAHHHDDRHDPTASFPSFLTRVIIFGGFKNDIFPQNKLFLRHLFNTSWSVSFLYLILRATVCLFLVPNPACTRRTGSCT